VQKKSITDDFTGAGAVVEVYNVIRSERTANEMWRWFVIGTLIFLLLELLIQKFVK
jgi:hypothetical protein